MKNHNSNNMEHQDDGHSHQAFDNPGLFAKRFDAPERDEWQKPEQVIDALNLSDNATVVEIGAGTGYFTVRLAEQLKNGNVIALETSPKMAAHLENRVGGSALKNVHVRLSEPGGQTNLPEKIDLIMCVDSYHHITDRVVYFSQLIQQLKQGGRLVIIDRPADSPVVPPHGHQTPPDVVKKEMKEAGFELTQELDLLLPYQFYLAFEPIAFTKNCDKTLPASFVYDFGNSGNIKLEKLSGRYLKWLVHAIYLQATARYCGLVPGRWVARA